MKRVIPVIVALVLIVIIGYKTFGGERKTPEELNAETIMSQEYYGVSSGEYAIIHKGELTGRKAIAKNNTTYISYEDVCDLLTNNFYLDEKNEVIFFTDDKGISIIQMGADGYTTPEGEPVYFSAPVTLYESERVWMSVDFLKKFSNFEFRVHPYRMYLRTEWDSHYETEVKDDTFLRSMNNSKGLVIREVSAGEKVEVVENSDNWSKVITSDDNIGYIKSSLLGYIDTVNEKPVITYEEADYTQISMGEKVILGYHAIAGAAGNDTIYTVIKDRKAMNVIAPTWFSLNDDEGGYRSFASSNYVKIAHNSGLKVWGVLDDFNFEIDYDTPVDVHEVMRNYDCRTHLIGSIVAEAESVGLDGICLDFETLGSEDADSYGEFLRELSLSCHEKGLILSTSNYVPYSYNNYQRFDVQGNVVDYVIIMGYDEHVSGSSNVGSVASLEYVTFGMDKALEEVDRERIINALPLYTIEWHIDGDEVSDSYLIYNEVDGYLNTIKETPVWNEAAGQNYLERKVGSATYKMWIEDSESLLAKINAMDAREIAGAAIWRLGYDDSSVWKIMTTYSKT